MEHILVKKQPDDRIRCSLFHATDGHCCADGEACLVLPLKKDLPYPMGVRPGAYQKMPPLLVLLACLGFSLGLWALGYILVLVVWGWLS